MSKFTATMVTGDNITAIVDGKPYSANRGHQNYNGLLAAIREDNADAFLERFSPVDKMVEYVKQEVEKEPNPDGSGFVYNEDTGEFFYGGIPLHNAVTMRINHLRKEGMPFAPMLAFLRNLMQNPSMTSINELYSFLEHGNMPITEDGCFIGYKAVCTYVGSEFTDIHGNVVKYGDLVDKHSRSVRNNVGDSPEIPRNFVDDDREKACSFGYHVGSLEYSGPNGWFHNSTDTVLLVKVNPKDAVSVPLDASCQKLRCCKYEVIAIYEKPLEHSLYSSSGSELDDYDDYALDYEDEDFEDKPDFIEDLTELYEGDEVKFWYTSKTSGERKYRHAFLAEEVDEDDTLIKLRLGLQDPSYGEHDYMNCVIANMEEVVLVR